MQFSFEAALITISACYRAEAEKVRGTPSLARVATVILNRGSFFKGLEEGRSCSVRNFEKCITWFSRLENWPREVPLAAKQALAQCGRTVRSDLSTEAGSLGRPS